MHPHASPWPPQSLFRHTYSQHFHMKCMITSGWQYYPWTACCRCCGRVYQSTNGGQGEARGRRTLMPFRWRWLQQSGEPFQHRHQGPLCVVGRVYTQALGEAVDGKGGLWGQPA